MENQAKGHGEYREIVEDEFLKECTSSVRVVVHFFHGDFERCKIMDKHLRVIAPKHDSCKFVSINADKAPFFVTKLAIRTLPTLLVFHDGVCKDRVVGFEELGGARAARGVRRSPCLCAPLLLTSASWRARVRPDDAGEDDFPTRTLEVRLHTAGAIMLANKKKKKGGGRAFAHAGTYSDEEDESERSDDDDDEED